MEHQTVLLLYNKRLFLLTKQRMEKIKTCSERHFEKYLTTCYHVARCFWVWFEIFYLKYTYLPEPLTCSVFLFISLDCLGAAMLRRLIDQLSRLWHFMMDATKELCMRILLTFILFTGYFICSMIIYAAMRHILVPQKTHALPVHLYFK